MGRRLNGPKEIVRPARGELEIVSLLESYIKDEKLTLETMGRGFAWFDTGTHLSLLEASNFVQSIQSRQGWLMSCPEEIAFNNGWIGEELLLKRAADFSNTEYGHYLTELIQSM